MKRLVPITTLFVLAFLILGTSLFAQDDPADSNNVSTADKHFVTEAAEGGLAEVELGQLAANKASSQNVKDFGQKMADDHGKANQELKDCAQKLGIGIPDHMSATEMAEKAKLSAYSGSHFDRSYMAHLLADHRQDIAAFKREAADGQNPEIKAFASKTLPTLEEHLRLAEQTERDIRRGSGPSSTSGGAAMR